ncbi:Putative small GTP-binding protein [Septoria linicola]|uniref:Elongation factor-like 1 n=1 Tax=Septoria linicola TaxID=215465 RepID=A0A9Q9EHK6_9PEZI|nr:Putative small GTP-binding protein [Septoria linicola]
MPVVAPEKLVKLQQAGDTIRNICILAHVDHGKTSLTDGLIATNGIISPKQAGKVRYLDSRPDEQERGITMESSAISLYFPLLQRTAPDAEPEQKEYLINLIDSPGHIDFSSEVSTASRLCDGAIVLVDAVEGVCSQTVTVLRQVWTEKLKPLLVINKMDRLITELKLSPGEAYTHLSKLLEQVNAVVGSFALGERMEDDLKWRERIDEKVSAAAAAKAQDDDARSRHGSIAQDDNGIITGDAPDQYEEKDDEDIYFEPEKNNVIFATAIDGWAFTPRQFAVLYEKKLGIKRNILEKCLWGDFYLDPKSKRVLGSKHLKGRNLKPMFVQLVLETIWMVYEATTGGPNNKGDEALLEKVTKSLGIKIPAHILRSKDPKALLSAVFSAWLPLSTAVLVSVIMSLPSPKTAQENRIPALLENSPGSEHIDDKVKDAMTHSDATIGKPVVAYVSKMVSIPESELPSNKRRGGALTAEEARELGRKKRAEIARAQALASSSEAGVDSVTDALSTAAIGDDDELDSAPAGEEEQTDDPEHLIGFARLLSGTLTVGDEVYVLPPKFTPATPNAEPLPKKVTVTALYLLMGRGLESLNSVPAGNIVGIAGLEGAILKSGTISSQLEGAPNLSSTTAISTNAPIVRVALEPAFPGDLDKMVRGLQLLVQADPAVSYEQLESGEHVILTAGELHLERCMKDLQERFAKCEIQAGEAMVPYRESIVKAEEMKEPQNPALGRGKVEGITSSKQLTIRLAVRPLPAPVTEFLVKHTGAVKRLYSERKAQEDERSSGTQSNGQTDETEEAEAHEAEAEDTSAGADQGLSMAEFKQKLGEAFVKEKADREVFKDAVNNIAAFGPRRVGPNVLIDTTTAGVCGKFFHDNTEQSASHDASAIAALADKIAYAFQLATYQGPLCNEPMQGVAIFLEEVATELSEDEISANMGRLTGEVLRTVRDSIRQGFLDWSPRFMLAMYSCEIQASTEVLSKVYNVIGRRNGRIVDEQMLESTNNFTVLSLLPVAESFGFSDEIRQRTSGFAAPQLVFEGFEMIDEDPYWVPYTEEQLEDLGDKADKENVALRYVDKVRTRKGLAVKKKVVEAAEKQKTLKR